MDMFTSYGHIKKPKKNHRVILTLIGSNSNSAKATTITQFPAMYLFSVLHQTVVGC